MYDVKGFPPTALETLRMLAKFTDSEVALTVESDESITFIRSTPDEDEAGSKDSIMLDVLKRSSNVGGGGYGWLELNDAQFISPFSTGRFYNLSFNGLSGISRLCLFRSSNDSWSKSQLLLMDQTRQVIEHQFDNYFFEKSDDATENEERFRLLFEFSPVGVFFYNTSLFISAFNQRFVSILKTDAAKLLNFDLHLVKDQSILPAIKVALSGEEGFYEGPYNATLSHALVNVMLKTAPIYNKSGEITGVIGVVQDNTERINTFKALKESKNRLSVLINATPDIICFKDAEGRWMEANESIQQLFRLKGKDFLFKSEAHLKCLVPELAEVFEQCTASDQIAWREKGPIVAEEIVPMPNGDERRLDVIKTPVFDELGNRKGIVILGRDITARKKAEEMLRESEERFRIVATHANDIIFEWDPETDRMSWFGKAGYFGTAKTPPRSFAKFIELLHPGDRDRISHFWKERFLLKEEWKDEFRVELNNGDMKYYRASGIMIFKDGKPEKAIGTFTNVTQEKNLINSLRGAVDEAQQNQTRIIGLLSVIPDLIFVFDRDGVIIDYHNENDHSFYVSPDIFIDRNVDDVLPPETAALTHEKIEAVLAHRGIETYEYQLSVRGEFEMYESRMVFVDEDRIFCIVRDVTHARKVELDLIKAKEQAEKSDRLKSAFLANMSHEIRTPMNGILGFSELLRNNDLSQDDRNNCIDVIVKSGQQLLAIINDVLEVSQLETGQVMVLNDRVYLNRLISDLARFFEVEASEKSVDLSYDVPEQNLFYHVDGGKITQIFNNLLSNAFKYTPPGGHVVFGFEYEEDQIRFFVCDDGVGIAAKHHKLIFERFGQVLKVGAKNKGGTGLGLSICKSLVELMGGKIWVEAEAGHGASLFFTLPVQSFSD
jgi:PAS domain S-box-containing protein